MKHIRHIALLALVGIFIGFMWLWVSTLNLQSPTTRASSLFPWPIACSWRGCITSKEWVLQRSYDVAFAKQTNKSQPTEAETLTTILRRHIISHASLASPVSIKDAVRYRTAILRNTEIDTLKPLGIASFPEYDSMVILPFLQQEALMQQRDIKNAKDLYADISKHRSLFLLLFQYQWNIDKGKVIAT